MQVKIDFFYWKICSYFVLAKNAQYDRRWIIRKNGTDA